MRRSQNIFDGVAKISQTFTAATTNICTATAHGFSNGDKVFVSSGTTLPAGLSASTDYFVVVINANTFYLTAALGGAIVDITDAGTGTHTIVLKGKTIFCEGMDDLMLSFNTTGTAALTMKVQASNKESAPDFNAAQSDTNPWDYLGMYDTEDGSFVDGDTGVVLASADDNRQFKLNIGQARWVSVIVSGWSAGLLRANLTMSEKAA